MHTSAQTPSLYVTPPTHNSFHSNGIRKKKSRIIVRIKMSLGQKSQRWVHMQETTGKHNAKAALQGQRFVMQAP